MNTNSKKKREIKFLEGEVWYPAVSEYGPDAPYDESATNEVVLVCNPTHNQMQPLLISNRGRTLYASDGYTASFQNGKIVTDDSVILTEGAGDLKGAFLTARDRYFAKEPVQIAEELITKPLYNTWMYASLDVTQEKVIAYANEILAQGLPAGTLMIDDKWSKEYGDWRFDEAKFPAPKKMLSELHDLGFAVMLWVCPYVSFGTSAFEACKKNNLLLLSELERCGESVLHPATKRKNESNLAQDADIFRLEWWNETSACLDLRKEKARAYLRNAFSDLQKLGVDGFKFDGGDSYFYLKAHEPDRQSYLWTKLAAEYTYNELRAEYNGAGLSVYERLSDKRRTWGRDGVGGILPAALMLGLSGHPFFSPDMIGGGEITDIREGRVLQKDLFLAHAQTAILMPSVQFSILPSDVLGEEQALLHSLMRQRAFCMPYIKELTEAARVSKEPIVRLMEYEFPGEGFEKILDQFMLGDRYLVKPITTPQVTCTTVRLPKGQWRQVKSAVTDNVKNKAEDTKNQEGYKKDTVYEGGRDIMISAGLGELTIFKKKLDLHKVQKEKQGEF